jgi:hypothetical protein
MWSFWVWVVFIKSEGDLAQQKRAKNAGKLNIKSGFYSILVRKMLIMMTTGHIGIGWPNPDGGALAHNRHTG